jgi:hypothetical protein
LGGNLLVVLGLDGFGRNRVADGGLGEGAAEGPVGQVAEAKLEQLIVPEALRIAGLRHQLEIDHLGEQDGTKLLGRDLVEVLPDVLGGKREVCLGDRFAADGGNNRVRTRRRSGLLLRRLLG